MPVFHLATRPGALTWIRSAPRASAVRSGPAESACIVRHLHGEHRIDHLTRLAGLLVDSSDTVMLRWRTQVRELPSARDLDVPALNDHIPGLLSELAEMLLAHENETIPAVLRNSSSTSHGLQRVQDAICTRVNGDQPTAGCASKRTPPGKRP